MMNPFPRAAVIIRFAEIIFAIVAVILIASVFMTGGSAISLWRTIALMESSIGGLALLAFTDLNLRLARRWQEFVPPGLLRLSDLSVILIFMWLVSYAFDRYLSFRLFDTTILFDAVFLVADTTMLSVVVSLLFAILHLNRANSSDDDARQ